MIDKNKKSYIIYIGFFIILSCIFINYTTSISENFDNNTHKTVKIEHPIKKTKKDAPKEVSGVPLVIYRTWHTSDIPKGMFDTISENAKITPEFDNYLYTTSDCLKFIQANFKDEPNIAKAYECLKPESYRSDLWRFCIIYKKGGIYMDAKFKIHTPLIDILKDNPDIYVWHWKDGRPIVGFEDYNEIAPGIMASPPGNPVLKACIDKIVENCKTRNLGYNCLDTTGPVLLGRIMNNIKGRSYILPFKINVEGGPGFQQIFYNDTLIVSEYENYRSDQISPDIALTKKPHYSTMWDNNDVFDTSIIFD